MRPVLLRPPFCRKPSVKPLTGLPFHSSLRSTMTRWRCDGVVGLNVLSAIALNPGGHVDARAFGQRNDRFLVIGTAAGLVAEPLGLALDAYPVDRLDLDVEQPLDGGLDLALGRGERHPEDHLVVLRGGGRLFGDDRRAHDVVHLLPGEPRLGGRYDAKSTHFRRASSCCTASRVNTSVSRRRMS